MKIFLTEYSLITFMIVRLKICLFPNIFQTAENAVWIWESRWAEKSHNYMKTKQQLYLFSRSQ